MPESIRLKIYYLCMAVSVLLSVCMFMLISHKKGVRLKDAVSIVSMGIVSAFLGVMLMAKLDNAVTAYVTDGMLLQTSRFRLLGSLVFPPLALLRPMKSYPYKYNDIMDYLSPGLFLSLGVSKIGCAVYGCCYGEECTFGITNPITGLTHFPVQLLEVFLGVVIAFAFFFVILYSKKYVRGSIYPLGLILFCSGRFILEFFRYYEFPKQEDLFLFMNFWQIVCLAGIIAGALWLAGVIIKNKKCISTI